MTEQDQQHISSDEVIHEAFVVDEKGNEVPITREMIDKAANMLEKCLTPFACYKADYS